MTGFGVRVFQARMALSAKRGRPVTQADVGRALGITGAAVSRWESGDKEPPLDTIAKLAHVLGVTAGHLAFGEGELATGVAAAAAIDPARDRKVTATERETKKVAREKRDGPKRAAGKSGRRAQGGR